MEFLQRKWSLFFTLLDVNHDGLITKEDVDKVLKNVSLIDGITKSSGEVDTSGQIEKWWNKFVLKGRDKISEDEFIQDLHKQYNANREQFTSMITSMQEEIINVEDTDKNNVLSLDEYVNAYKIWGHDNETLIRRSFRLYKPDNGMIPIQEYIDDWVIFLTNTDECKPGVVMKTFMFWANSKSE